MRKYIAIGMVLLFTAMMLEPSNAMLMKTKATIGIYESSRDQVELKYYDPNTLHNDYPGIEWAPHVWKEGIRLTQTELARYRTWNLTQVIIGFAYFTVEGPMNIRIYIYEKGDATHPGNVIENDTTTTLNWTGLITVPLVTPVPIADNDEIWIAIEWNQTYWIKPYYTFWDAGPAVRGKGDWIYEYNQWQEGYNVLVDSNWALGAVVEGQGLATLGIGNIKGPIGIKAEVQNTGDVDALNLTWSIVVKGGILDRINKTATGTATTLIAHMTLPINVLFLIGFGKITIAIDAKAINAAEVSVRKSAFLVGPFLIGIK